MIEKTKSILKTALKLSIAFAALGYVLYDSDHEQILKYIKSSNPLYLIGSFIFLNFMIISIGFRLRVYFKTVGVKLNKNLAAKISYIGAFFNLFFPGGTGADGYTTVFAKKNYDVPVLRGVRLMLACRANGLFFLNLIFFTLIWFSDFMDKIPYSKPIIIGLFILQVPVYYVASRLILKEDFKTFLKAGMFSAILQIFSIASALMVFHALGMQDNHINYLCLYIAAAIMAILPITPGGVGIRELIFLKGSELINLDPEFGVANSLIFFAIYFLSALTGLFFYLKKDNVINKQGA